jgi:hypothetical protein
MIAEYMVIFSFTEKMKGMDKFLLNLLPPK